MEQTIKKNTKLCAKVILNNGTCHNQTCNVLGCSVPELLQTWTKPNVTPKNLQFIFPLPPFPPIQCCYIYIYYIYTIFLCSVADFDKNGTNN